MAGGRMERKTGANIQMSVGAGFLAMLIAKFRGVAGSEVKWPNEARPRVARPNNGPSGEEK
jgi:hypothetical protein